MNKPFDPWTATEEELQAVFYDGVELLTKRGSLPRDHNFSKLVAWRSVSDLENKAPFDGWQVLRAVEACLRAGITAPDWLFKEYSDRLNRVGLGKAAWNDPEVFGPERPKYHRDTRDTNTAAFKLWQAIENGELPKLHGSSHYRDQLSKLAEKLGLGISGAYAEKILTDFRKKIKKLPKLKP